MMIYLYIMKYASQVIACLDALYKFSFIHLTFHLEWFMRDKI